MVAISSLDRSSVCQLRVPASDQAQIDPFEVLFDGIWASGLITVGSYDTHSMVINFGSGQKLVFSI